MDRFLKRTELPVSPAPKKPKVSSKQCVISASLRTQDFGLYFYESGGKLFYNSCNLVIDHHRKFLIKRHIEYRFQDLNIKQLVIYRYQFKSTRSFL